MRTALVRLALATALLLFVLFVLLLALLPGQGEARARSVFSAEEDGWRALYLSLEGLGFPVAPWTRAPGDLEPAGALLVLPALPEPPPQVPAALQAEGERALVRGRDLGHYRSFVERGGTLLAFGVGADELAFLREQLGLAGLDGLDFESRALEPATLLGPAGERLECGGALPGVFTPGSGRALVLTAEGEPVGVLLPSGAGRVALLALPAERLGTGELREAPDALLLVVRVVEALGPFQRLLFDEYALGAWRPPSALALAFRPRWALLSLHLLVALGLFLVRAAWSGPFPCDPEPLRAVSPLARARGFGRLLVRAGRVDLLAGFLREGMLARLEPGRARGLAREASTGAQDLDAGDDGARAARLWRLAPGDAARQARLAELWSRQPSSEAELARLAQELAALEPELPRPGRISAASPGARHVPTGS